MAEIAGVDVIADKWARVTPTRTQDYEDGVRNPRRDWLRATIGAVDSWKAGIQEAIAKKTFEKGVTRAGSTAWQQGAIEKGLARWGPGVQVAKSKYSAAFAPFVAAIKALTLPPRFARRDPRNLLRVAAVVDALVKTKLAQMT